MTKRIVGFLTIMCCLNAFGTTINLQGKITKEGSDAVEGALVFLKSYPGITTLSGSDGAFTLSGNTRVLIDPWMKGMNGIALRSMKRGAGILVRTNSNQSNMKIDIYKINGGLMASKQLQGKSAGEYAVPFSNTANEAYIVKVAFGNESRIFKAIPGMGLSCAMISEAQGVKSAGLGKAAGSVSDSLVVFKQGFRTSLTAVQTYEKNDLNVSLTASNPWVPTEALERSKGMVKIKAKSHDFEMGQPDAMILGTDFMSGFPIAEFEQPVHTVSFLHDFWMDTAEVTQAEFDSLMKKSYSNYSTPLWDETHGIGPNYPTYYANWSNAVLFCNARSKEEGLTDTVYSYASISGQPGTTGFILKTVSVNSASKAYRLPTEAEWEYACKAGTFTEYYWGKDYSYYREATVFTDVDSYAVWKKNSFDIGAGNPGFGPHVVASTLPNKYGLYDMAGNVSEFCHEDFMDYQWGAITDSVAAKIDNADWKYHAMRGGSWATDVSNLRSANRYFDMNSDYYHFLWGFRLVRTAED